MQIDEQYHRRGLVMALTSWSYAIFLLAMFILHWIVPAKHRWIPLLAASFYFYLSWGAAYVFPILFIIAISYSCAVYMETKEKGRKRAILIASLVIVLGILILFKYLGFFMSSITAILQLFAIPISPITLSLIQPIGISFFTFQTVGYLVDVYKGKVPAERHIGKYALFVSFFPQILSGPIARADSLIPQLKVDRRFSYDQATYGLKQMAWGLFKKLCIADTMGYYVDKVYGDLSHFRGLSLVIVMVFYSIQIYCDFSGYTDIAIGSAKLFGIDLMTNFRSPYFSASVKEFWSRWHISLSTWLRDYLYIPLGGNRRGEHRKQLNILITFLISGLWHGANWTFVIWGGLHGMVQCLENLAPKKRISAEKRTIGRLLSVFVVFAFCTCAWVFFRASSVHDAIYVFRNMFSGFLAPAAYVKAGYKALNIDISTLIRLCLLIVPLFAYDFYALRNDPILSIGRLPLVGRWAIYLVFMFFIIYMMPLNSNSGFIYARF